jgi:hypothetical protein
MLGSMDSVYERGLVIYKTAIKDRSGVQQLPQKMLETGKSMVILCYLPICNLNNPIHTFKSLCNIKFFKQNQLHYLA